jgi:hypothetical protein
MSFRPANPFVLSLSKDRVCRKLGFDKLSPNGIVSEISNV